MADHIVTIVAKRSTIKFALFMAEGESPSLVASGHVTDLDAAPRLHARSASGAAYEIPLSGSDHHEAVRSILKWIAESYPDAIISGFGHRVAHGGHHYSEPVLADSMVLANLWMLAALAPLHQPYNLASIEAARAAFPDVPQIACFDTAFHRGHDFVNDAYALPLGYYQRGMRRYGFHGLSYEFILRQMHEIDPVQSNGRIIMAHLSSGASLCAIKEGRSVASTMGFTTLDGLPMATRCGQIDPGLLLYLLEHDKMSVADLSRLLYEQSGLKGLSGVSSDISVLETSHSEHAKMAIDYFVHRIRTEIGGLAAILGGLDSLVFSGAVGEVSARIREAVLRDMEWLGVTLDTEANANNALRISTGPTKVFVIPTDQEMMIAHHVIKTARLGVSAA